MALNVNLSNVSAYAEAIYILTEGASTIKELCEESGLGDTTIRKFVASLKRRGLVRIAAWVADSQGRNVIAAYQWGKKADVKRPPVQTLQERQRRYKAKIHHLAMLRGTPVRHTRIRTYEMPRMRCMDGSP